MKSFPLVGGLAVIAGAVLAGGLYFVQPVSAQTPWYASVDCDMATADIQADCTYPSGTTSASAGVYLTNDSGADVTVGTFQFDLVHDDKATFTPVTSSTNPVINPGLGSFSCNPPGPLPDWEEPGDPPERARSRLVCYSGSASFPNGSTILLGTVNYDVNGDGSVPLTLENVAVTNTAFVELMSCNPVIDIEGDCFPATLTVGSEAATPTVEPTDTATATNTATNTPVPATSTPTNTATNTPTNTPVPPTSTSTNTPTATDTPVPGATDTPVPTNTPVPPNTATPTNTATSTSTNTPTVTNTPVPGATDTPTPTNTPVPATSTPTDTATATNTPLPGSTNTPTATNTPVPTSTNTATATNTAIATSTNTPVATSTNTPVATSTNTPVATATTPPTNGCARADVNGDGTVNVLDVLKVVIHIGPWWRYDERYDVNLDGRINGRDLGIVLSCLFQEPRGR